MFADFAELTVVLSHFFKTCFVALNCNKKKEKKELSNKLKDYSVKVSHWSTGAVILNITSNTITGIIIQFQIQPFPK